MKTEVLGVLANGKPRADFRKRNRSWKADEIKFICNILKHVLKSKFRIIYPLFSAVSPEWNK